MTPTNAQQTRRAARLATCVLTLLMAACGGGGGGAAPAAVAPAPAPEAGAVQRDRPDNGRPFVFPDEAGMRASAVATVTGNPIEQILIQCAVTLRTGQECSLNQLPLLGMSTPAPGVDDVMNRVLVSHAWMGTRFRAVLEKLPPDILLLMRSVTAIVISHDIRPSFYTTQTGAIYLDPDDLWLTTEEQAVIDTAPDFRSEFGRALKFTMLWRYVKDNQHATRLSDSRTLDDLVLPMASLLYHELAHATDFFNPQRFAQLDGTVPIYRAVLLPVTSDRLAGTFPLTSADMRALAQVSFRGVTATPEQQALVPADVAFAFTGDSASDYYNYSTTREDLAMVFEEAMMLYSFGVDRDVGVTNLPLDGTCTDYKVAWGVRNRVVNPAVAVRAVFAVRELLPSLADAVDLALQLEEPPTAMTAGEDWCVNIFLDPLTAAPRAQRGPEFSEQPERLIPYL